MTISLPHSLRAGAAASLTALALAACGGTGDDAGGGGSAGKAAENKALEGALKFARCMREQGLDFPDPRTGEGGMIKIGPGPGSGGDGPDPSDPGHEAARKVCGKFLEAGGGPAEDPATRAKFQDAFVKYAGCMRRNGVDVPDPPAGGGGILIRPGDTSAPDPESPKYRAADAECRHHLAAVDEAVKETSR